MPMTILENLINEITVFYNIKPNKIEQMFIEELKSGLTEEEAADNVRKRIDFLMI